jgi:hypothetical protein
MSVFKFASEQKARISARTFLKMNNFSDPDIDTHGTDMHTYMYIHGASVSYAHNALAYIYIHDNLYQYIHTSIHSQATGVKVSNVSTVEEGEEPDDFWDLFHLG